MENTKKCPMCAEEIPLAAATCKYCDAQFAVTSSGYCQNCHEVRDADENGQCKACGNSVVDFRVESRFIEEVMQEPIPISQPIAQTEIPKSEKRHVPFGVLALGLILVAVGSFLLFGRSSIPVVFNLFASATSTATQTFTPTVTATPSMTPTRTPSPTPTVTPDLRILNPANQHQYLYVKIPKGWHEARDYCAARGGHLVTIQDAKENTFVYNLATDNDRVFTWLGASDDAKEGTWVWVTGERWSYQHWGHGQPDDYNKSQDYQIFQHYDPNISGTYWDDVEDNEGGIYFVCEWES